LVLTDQGASANASYMRSAFAKAPVTPRVADFYAAPWPRIAPPLTEHRAPAQLLLQDDGTGRVDAVKLKHGLGQIDPQCSNLHVGDSFPLLVPNSTSMAHRDAVRVEPSTPSERLSLRPVGRFR